MNNNMGYGNNNMGYDQNGMDFDQNNMGYGQNGMGYGQNGMGGYPQQPMGGMNQPMQQQQMMQQQRFGGMNQGYGMNQPMMNNQPMQQGYGMNDPMMQQPMYDQPNTSFGGHSSGSGSKQNPVPIIIAMILVLVIGGVIIALLLKGDDSDSGSSKKKSKDKVTEIEIKKPSSQYTGNLSDYSALKKYYEDSFNATCEDDGTGTCFINFKKGVYLSIEKEGSKVKRVMVGDTSKNKDTYIALLYPFANTAEKEKEIENSLSWMEDGLLYSDKEFELSVNDTTAIIRPEPYQAVDDNLIDLKENNKFTLSNIKFGKRYTVDVEHFNNNLKPTLRSLSGDKDTSRADISYEENGTNISITYKFDEDKLNFESEYNVPYFKEYRDTSSHEKGGNVCYVEDNSIECFNYLALGDSPMGYGYKVYFITKVRYQFESSAKIDANKQKASEYIKKLGTGVKVSS